MVDHDFDYTGLIKKIKSDIEKNGGVTNLELQRYLCEIDRWADAYRITYKKTLKSDWEFYFGTEEYSEDKVNEKVNTHIDSEKQKAINNFLKQLKTKEKIEVVQGMLVKKGIISYGIGIIISLIITVIGIISFSSKSDMFMYIGLIIGLGGFITLVICIHNFLKGEKNA